ncbi:MAG: hypothetical protein Q4Q58_05695 [Thermoplasmata archaeon]|nr:hypothetical protein [Thermoplasmata archaeon]
MSDVRNSESLVKLRKICKYGVWILIAAIAIMAALAMASITELIICLLDSKFTIFPMDHGATTISVLSTTCSALSGLFVCVLTYRIAITISCDRSPFSQDNVMSMKRIAFICILTFAIMLILEVALFLKNSDIYQLEFPFQLGITGVLTYIFSLLFEYGAVLQTESDEFL